MLEKIMNLVKSEVSSTIGGMDGIPEEKKSAAIETTAGSLLDGLKKYATPETMSMLVSKLGVGSSGGSSSAGAMGSGLESSVVSALTSKVGLSRPVAQKIASAVIPAVMSLFSKKVADQGDPGFNLESLARGLSGKGSGGGGGIMDMLGGIMGKKG